MDLRNISEDITRIRGELEHLRRARTNVERTKVHIGSNIQQIQHKFDEAMQIARRAQDNVREVQVGLEEETRRLHIADQSLEQIAEKELIYAAQLRDLTQALAAETQRSKRITGGQSTRGFHRYR